MSRRGTPTLYHWTVDVPSYDSDGQPLTYASGQQMQARTSITVSAQHVTPITDDLVLRIGVGADGAGQSVLLARRAVTSLRDALALPWFERTPAVVVSGAGAGHSRLEIEFDHRYGNPVLTVVGYGHDWKRRRIPMSSTECDRLKQALESWLQTGWAKVAKVDA